jgi:hypothetical protein
MKIGVITPHRNDRPEFLAQFKKYMAAQTVQPDIVNYVDYEPESEGVDISQRYKRGFTQLESFANLDLILFMEVDDYYAPNYVETMVSGWINAEKPYLFGIGSSIYYHISGKWFSIGRPSMMSMAVRSGLNINWGNDNYPYADITLCNQLSGQFMEMPEKQICIGIKHGIGLVGGGCHNSDSGHYRYNDLSGQWLLSVVGDENFEFYKQLKNK